MNLESQSLGTLELIVRLKDVFEGQQDLSCLETLLYHLKGYIDLIERKMPTIGLKEEFLIQLRGNLIGYIDEKILKVMDN